MTKLKTEDTYRGAYSIAPQTTANLRLVWVGVQAIKQIHPKQTKISTANSGGSLLMVQSVSGGCKLDSKFAVQSNTSEDRGVGS